MAVTASPRLGITRWSVGTDPFNRGQLDGDNGRLDDLVAIDLQGLRSARPAPAIRGRYYKSTDTGVLYRDTGAAWQVVGADLEGPVTVTPASGSASALVLKSALAQAAALLQVQDSAGGYLGGADALGRWRLAADSFNLTLTAGWLLAGAPYPTALRAIRSASAEVVLEGVVQVPAGGAAAGAVIATLPAGWRPAATVVFGSSNLAGAGRTVGVNAAGQIYSLNAIAAGEFLSLCGLPFRTAG